MNEPLDEESTVLVNFKTWLYILYSVFFDLNKKAYTIQGLRNKKIMISPVGSCTAFLKMS